MKPGSDRLAQQALTSKGEKRLFSKTGVDIFSLRA
jgi:hypothetical protein